MISEQQFRDQVRLLEGQIRLFRLRTTTLRDTIVMAHTALSDALPTIVLDEMKRSTMRAIHLAQRTLDDDNRRYSDLDN